MIISRKEFNKLKSECKCYEDAKLLMVKCLNEVYHINMNMFNELMELIKYYGKNI